MVRATQLTLERYQVVRREQAKKILVVPDFLGGEFHNDVLKEVISEYGDYRVIRNGAEGSNPYFVVAVNEKIKPLGLRTVTPLDAERIRVDGSLPLLEHCIETAFVIRSPYNPHGALAKNLLRQVRHRKGIRARMPVMIPFAGLELKRDSNAEYGLAFRLSEDAQLIYAPGLNSPDASSFSEIDMRKGIPKRLDENGKRVLWTEKEGVTILSLTPDGDLSFRNERLYCSAHCGRIVIVSTSARAA